MWANLGNAFLEGAGGAAGGAVLGSVFGQSDGSQRRQQRRDRNRALTDSINLMKTGNEMDMANQKAMFDYRITQGLVNGMTPYEMFVGSSAGGAGGGTTGSGQTLGNGGMQQAISQQQLNQDRQLQQQENNANRMTQLIQTKMQTDAQKYGADKAAGATEYAADIQELIANNRLSFDEKQYNEIVVPQATADLNLTVEQLNEQVNKTTTSSPQFLRAMKILTMSAENLLATVLINGQPIDITDQEQLSKQPANVRNKLVTSLVGVTSRAYREATGIQAKSNEVLQVFLDTLENDFAKTHGMKPSEMSEAEMRAFIKKRNDATMNKYLDQNSNTSPNIPNLGNYPKPGQGLPPTLGVEG